MDQQESVRYILNKHTGSRGVPGLDKKTLGLEDCSSVSPILLSSHNQ